MEKTAEHQKQAEGYTMEDPVRKITCSCSSVQACCCPGPRKCECKKVPIKQE